MAILNLTQHLATAEQKAEGVVDFPPQWRDELVKALTFTALPSRADVEARASVLRELADRAITWYACPGEPEVDVSSIMIGGAPFLMAPLERALEGIAPAVYAFSLRESVEEKAEDGSVRKVSRFRHLGFV